MKKQKNEVPAMLRASSAYRYAMCPVSAKAEIGIPKEETTAIAERGQNIHLLAKMIVEGIKPDLSTVNPDHFDTAQIMVNNMNALIGEVSRGEERFEYEFKNLLLGWSGHSDYRFTTMTDGLQEGVELHIVDWKSGWKEVNSADINHQLRIYAALEAGECQYEKIHVYLIMPSKKNCSHAVFDKESIFTLKDEAVAISSTCAKATEADYHCGEWCQYCPAKATQRCPCTLDLPAKIVEESPLEKIAELPVEVIARLADQLSVAEQVLKAIKARAKELAAAGMLPGWTVSEGRTTNSVENTYEAYKKLPANFPEEALMSSMKLSLPDLAKQVKVVEGCSEKDAKFLVEEWLGDLIVEKKSEGSLKKVKS